MHDTFNQLYESDKTLTVSELTHLQYLLEEQFMMVCERYDVEPPDNDLYGPLFEETVAVILELNPETESVHESVTQVISDLEGDSAEGTILFMCGRLSAQRENAEITLIGQNIYGAVKHEEMTR